MYKVGDFCFYKFQLVQILKMNGNLITAVSDGNIKTTSGEDGYLTSICPLTLTNIANSNAMMRIKKELENKTRNINWTHIHSYLIEKWIDICNTEDVKKRNDIWEKVQNFKWKIIDIYNGYVDGVKVFD